MRATAVALLIALSCASAAASESHHHASKACEPAPAQEAAAARFAQDTAAGLERYLQIANAVADGFTTDGKPTNAIMHYDSKANRKDKNILDPLRPESLVYQNTYSGPRLLGALYTMAGSGRTYGPRFGGCLTKWHHHRICKSSVGFARPPEDGRCPPGFQSGRTTDMIHTWIVPMENGPYAHSADDRYRCWLKTSDCL